MIRSALTWLMSYHVNKYIKDNKMSLFYFSHVTIYYPSSNINVIDFINIDTV